MPNSCHNGVSTGSSDGHQRAVKEQVKWGLSPLTRWPGSVGDAEAGGSNPPFPTEEPAGQVGWWVGGNVKGKAIIPRLARALSRHNVALSGMTWCEAANRRAGTMSCMASYALEPLSRCVGG